MSLPSRKVVGVQIHHHTTLEHAGAYGANMGTALLSVFRRTGDPELLELIQAQQRITRRIGEKARTARATFEALHAEDPERFARCRDGVEPWPDETIGSFEPRCTCHDLCLHRLGVDPGPNGICNCEGVKPPCPAHAVSP